MKDLYLYRVFNSKRECVFEFKGYYMSCFEVLNLIQCSYDYVSCTRTKIKG